MSVQKSVTFSYNNIKDLDKLNLNDNLNLGLSQVKFLDIALHQFRS